MSKIKDTMNRAGAGIRKVGAGAHRVITAGGRKTDAALLVTAVALAGAAGWGLGHSLGWESARADNAVMYQAGMTTQGEVDREAVASWKSRADRAATDARDQVYREMNGIKLISELPDGVDRSKAQEAEQQRQGFMYTDWHGAAVLREPGGRTWYLPTLPTELGRSVTSGSRWNGIPFGDDDSADRAARWAAAKRMGAAYAYRDQSGYRVDTAYCTGYWVSLTVPRAGTAVEATTPPLAGAACDRTSPTPRVPVA